MHTGSDLEVFLAWCSGEGPDAGFLGRVGAAELVEVLLPFAVLVWLSTVRRLWFAWPILLIATISTAPLGALFWHLLRTAANQLG